MDLTSSQDEWGAWYPTQAAKDAAWMGHPSVFQGLKFRRGKLGVGQVAAVGGAQAIEDHCGVDGLGEDIKVKAIAHGIGEQL